MIQQEKTADTALTINQIETKLAYVSSQIRALPMSARFSSVGIWHESGERRKPSEYDLLHFHMNRLLTLRDARLAGQHLGE